MADFAQKGKRRLALLLCAAVAVGGLAGSGGLPELAACGGPGRPGG